MRPMAKLLSYNVHHGVHAAGTRSSSALPSLVAAQGVRGHPLLPWTPGVPACVPCCCGPVAGGIAYNVDEFKRIVQEGIDASMTNQLPLLAQCC